MVLTVDVVFLAKAVQESAEVMSTLEIISCTTRKSTTPFGGVLIVGTLNQSQCQPLNAMPFLLSSLLTTCFTFVVLRESIRAAEDELEFQELQCLTRMIPNKLISDPSHKVRFYEVLEFFSI